MVEMDVMDVDGECREREERKVLAESDEQIDLGLN